MTALTATEHREVAAAHEKEAAASFERCDTDGFLSQWASGITASKHRAEADLADNDGLIECLALFDTEGNVVSTHQGFGQYGEYWVLNDEAAEKYGKRFFSPSEAQKPGVAYARDRAKGFVFGYVSVRGYVTVKGGGTGLGGALGVFVTTLPVVEDLKSGAYTVVESDIDRKVS